MGIFMTIVSYFFTWWRMRAHALRVASLFRPGMLWAVGSEETSSSARDSSNLSEPDRSPANSQEDSAHALQLVVPAPHRPQQRRAVTSCESRRCCGAAGAVDLRASEGAI